MKAAVVGHVELVEFLRVPHLPREGDIVEAMHWWELPAGGGAVSAVQLAKLAGEVTFFTAFGDDEVGYRAYEGLLEQHPGLQIEASFQSVPQRRAVTHIGSGGERTITVLGSRLSPRAADCLDWEKLKRADAVFMSGGDAEVVRMARSAPVLAATSRMLPTLAEAGVRLEAVIGSILDPAEKYAPSLDLTPGLVVGTQGSKGGQFRENGGPAQSYLASPLSVPLVDSYGAGDSFAAALTFAVATGLSGRRAVEVAARCGAAVVTGAGPYEAQLTAADLRSSGFPV